MSQCAIALNNFEELKHDSGHDAGPAEVQFLQVIVIGEVLYHALERIVGVVAVHKCKLLELAIVFNEGVHEVLHERWTHFVVDKLQLLEVVRDRLQDQGCQLFNCKHVQGIILVDQ